MSLTHFIAFLTFLIHTVLVAGEGGRQSILLDLLFSELSSIHVENGHFVDKDGRVMLFRGINSVIKHFPW